MHHLKEAGVSASNTEVFERPRDEAFVHKWQLACEGNKYHLSTPNEETILARDSAYISHGVVFIATHHSAQCTHTHAQMVGKCGDEPADLAAVVFLGVAALASLVLLEIRRRTKRRASMDDDRRRALLLAYNAVLLSHLLGVQLHAGLHLLGIAFSQPSWQRMIATVGAFFFTATLGVALHYCVGILA